MGTSASCSPGPGPLLFSLIIKQHWKRNSERKISQIIPPSHSSTHATCVLSRFSPVQLFTTPWTVACQASLSMGFSRQQYWSGFLCPPPGDLRDPGIKLASLMSPDLAGGFFTVSTTWKALYTHTFFKKAFWCAEIVENTHTHEYNKTGEIWTRSVDYITVNIPILQNWGRLQKWQLSVIISYNCMWICNYPNKTSIKRKTIVWSWNPWVGSISH